MTDQEKIEARLRNTEKALFCLMTVFKSLQPPALQEDIDLIMGDYFDANVSLGFEHTEDFKTLQE